MSQSVENIGNFLYLFLCKSYFIRIVSINDVRYFPKGIFPKVITQGTISQVATLQMCNFSKVRLGS